MNRAYSSKTGRRRGLIYAGIRGLAARGKPFTWRDIPSLPHLVAVGALKQMAGNGELLLLRAGRGGRYTNRPAVYQINPSYRHHAGVQHYFRCGVCGSVGWSRLPGVTVCLGCQGGNRIAGKLATLRRTV